MEQPLRDAINKEIKEFNTRVSNEDYDDNFTQSTLRLINRLQNKVEAFPYCKFFIASDLQVKMYQKIYSQYDIKYRLKVFNEEYEQ